MGRSLFSFGLAAALAGALGCSGGDRARRYAVTIADSPLIDCTGFVAGPFVDQETLDVLAKQAKIGWLEAHAAEPPTPAGNVLFLTALETEAHAWLEGGYYDNYPPNTNLPGAAAVYVGESANESFQGSFADVFNSDRNDEAVGLVPCGDRYHARGELGVTLIGDRVEGRVRWTAVEYIGSAYSACDGRIECGRDIAVEGLLFVGP